MMEKNDFRELYSTIVMELRHRHEVTWRARQVFAVSFLALLVLPAKIELSATAGMEGVSYVMYGVLGMALFDDLFRQNRKIVLLDQLYGVESGLGIPDIFCLGQKDRRGRLCRKIKIPSLIWIFRAVVWILFVHLTVQSIKRVLLG